MLKRLSHLQSNTKHLIHCSVLNLFIIYYVYKFVFNQATNNTFDPWQEYGHVWTYMLYFFRFLIFLVLPQCLFNFFGLTCYNAFINIVDLKAGAQETPFICFRVVTRGDYPDLVRRNLQRNLKTCGDIGLENFSFEIATDQTLQLFQDNRVREILIATDYQTKTGALFKARALQYCLEDDVNRLGKDDWIVHLDEETLLTENSVRGIVNFTVKGKHEFGQGVITYANDEIRNWLTTLADSFRVTEDYGKIRFQFLMFHRPIFGIKGSYVVTRYKAEKDVTFDHGLDGSIAEDCYFSMIAYKKSYTFDFIEGEMHEKSPFNIRDFLQQRKRWIQGIWLVVHSSKIPLKNKLFLGMSLYGWITLPLSTSNLLWAYFYPLPSNQFLFLNLVVAFTAAVNTYMYIFGVVKSFSIRRIGLIRFIACLVCSFIAIPFNVIIENIAVVWGVIGKKHKFYIVQKI